MSNVVTQDVRVAIVGAGFGGIAMAAALRRSGREDFVVLERAEGLGGVWRDNTYPGAACDIPSYLYSFSFDQRRDWSRPCPPQQEVLTYLTSSAERAGVLERVRTSCDVLTASWDEAAARWTLSCADGSTLRAETLVLACGQLSRPAIAPLAGHEDFAGPAFHTAEWDHGVDLRGKRVAIIGTGASAVQVLPPVAELAAHVDVYQRTAPWVLPRRNRPYAGWARAAIARLPGLQRLRRGFMTAFCEVGIAGQTRVAALRLGLRAWSTWHMRRQLPDPALRAKAWPDYPLGCKRVLFSSHYLPALGREDVELVTEPVARIAPEGPVTADGTLRPADVIVWGTGFRTHAFVAPMRVVGRDGAELAERWADGARAHLGISVHGFPGLHLLYGPNTNLGFGSIIVMLEAQVAHVLAALERAEAEGATALEVRPEREEASTAEVQRRLRGTVWTTCDSWYRQGGDGRIVNNWPGQMAEYVAATRAASPEDYVAVRPAVAAPA